MCGPVEDSDNFWPSKAFQLALLLYTFVKQAFRSITFFARTTVTCIESTLNNPLKEFPIPRPPCTRTHNSTGFRTSQCGYSLPARVNSARAGF